MNTLIKVLDYDGSPVQFEIVNGQVMMNATLAAKAFGKKPDDIFKTKSWKEYETALFEMKPHLRSEDIRFTKKGNYSSESKIFDSQNEQGSWIHQELALEFARRLNPKFSIWCNDMIAELLRTGTVSIKPRKTRQQKYVEQGKDPKWIKERVDSVSTRNTFTFTLKKHDVKDEGYRNCTNAIYAPLFGGTTAVVREKKGLEKKVNIRDNLSKIEITTISLIEQLAANEIESKNIRGNAQCELICTKVSRVVASAIAQTKK